MHVGTQISQQCGHCTLPSLHRRFSSLPNSSPLCSQALVSVIVFPELSIPHSTHLDNFCVQFCNFAATAAAACSSPSNRRVPLFLAVCRLRSETKLSRARPWTPGLACSALSRRSGHSLGDLRSATTFFYFLRASSQDDTRNKHERRIIQAGSTRAVTQTNTQHAHNRTTARELLRHRKLGVNKV